MNMVNDITRAFGAYALSGYRAAGLAKAQSMPANWLGRRMALFLRRRVLSKSLSIVDAVVDGLRFRLYMRDNVSERKFLFMPQFFDRYERDLLKRQLKAGDCFVDIGANAGIYTLTAAAAVGKTGRVVSIEPNPIVLERLKYNLSVNGFEDRVVSEQCAVSDAAGVFDLMLDETNLGGSSLVVERSAQKIQVQCDRLASILHRNNVQKISALKIDIEGAEDNALIPFFKEAPRSLYPAILIIEHSPQGWKQDLPAALKEAGYHLSKQTRMNQVWVLAAL